MEKKYLIWKSATTSWGYEDGPWKGPGPPLLVAADFLIFFCIDHLFLCTRTDTARSRWR
jgi:hypothetical protein